MSSRNTEVRLPIQRDTITNASLKREKKMLEKITQSDNTVFQNYEVVDIIVITNDKKQFFVKYT